MAIAINGESLSSPTAAPPVPARVISPRRDSQTPVVEPQMRKADAARTLSVCKRSVDGYIASGKLKIVKLGTAVRIDPRDLRLFIDAMKTTTET